MNDLEQFEQFTKGIRMPYVLIDYYDVPLRFAELESISDDTYYYYWLAIWEDDDDSGKDIVMYARCLVTYTDLVNFLTEQVDSLTFYQPRNFELIDYANVSSESVETVIVETFTYEQGVAKGYLVDLS